MVDEEKRVTPDIIEFYYSRGFSLLPLKEKSKEPLIKWSALRRHRLHKGQLRIILQKFPGSNIGVVCGPPSGNLFVLDFDDEDTYLRIMSEVIEPMQKEGLLPDGPFPTWTVRTGKGYHLYFRADQPVPTRKLCRTIDLRGDGAYVVAPPSIHPSGARYTPVAGFWVSSIDVPVLGMETVNELLARIRDACRSAGLLDEPERAGGGRGKHRFKTLPEETVQQVVELISPFYREGYRNEILFALSGYLWKAGVDPEQIVDIVVRIARANNDDELAKREYDARYWVKRMRGMRDEDIAGLSRLEELFQQIAGEHGLPGELAEETIRILRQLVEERYVVFSMTLERDEEGWTRRLYIYPDRIVVKHRNGKETIVSPSGIRRVHRLVFYEAPEVEPGFLVEMSNGTIYKGVRRRVIESVVQSHVSTAQYRAALQTALTELAILAPEKHTFYSPGWWVIENDLVATGENGYRPEWKPLADWEPPEEPGGEEDLGPAARILLQLFQAYRRPEYPVAALSFILSSVFAYWLRRRHHYYPNLLVFGSHNTGKGVLADTVRLLLNYYYMDPAPKTAYALQRLVTATTLPAIIEEFTFSDQKRQDLLHQLHELATTPVARTIDAGRLAGTYLNLRALIIMSNDRVLVEADSVDKIIPLPLDWDARIDPEKAEGLTPLTMPGDVAELMPRLGAWLVRRTFQYLREVRTTNRRGLIRSYFLAGWRALRDMRDRWAPDLPLPGIEEVIEEVSSVADEYEVLEYPRLIVHALQHFGRELPVVTVRDDCEGVRYELMERGNAVICAQEGRAYIPYTVYNMVKTILMQKYGIKPIGRKRLAKLPGITVAYKKSLGRYIIVSINT